MHIISEDLQDILWKKLYDECKLVLRSGRLRKWIRVPGKSSIYHKDSPWTEEQENLINSFLEELVDEEIYALDWQHDCFLFSPQEHLLKTTAILKVAIATCRRTKKQRQSYQRQRLLQRR